MNDPDELYCREFTVDRSMIDGNDHVNNVVFVQWMQDLAVEHSEHNGATKELYLELQVTWFAKSHQIEYLGQADSSDTVLAKTWLSKAEKVSCLREYTFRRKSDNGMLARASTRWVYINAVTGRPKRIDPQVLSCFTIGRDPA